MLGLVFSAFQLFSFLFCPPAFGHDPLEISATVYLHTNRLELRAVMMRKAVLLAADHQGVPLLDFSIPAERDEAMPMLRSLAPGLFTLTCGTNVLTASDVKVILGAEDHVGFDFTFPVEIKNENLRMKNSETATTNSFPLSAFHFPLCSLNARLLAQLPKQDPYGVNVTVLDLVNNEVWEQKLLNAQNPVMEIARPPSPVERRSPNRPAAAPSLIPAGSKTGVPK